MRRCARVGGLKEESSIYSVSGGGGFEAGEMERRIRKVEGWEVKAVSAEA